MGNPKCPYCESKSHKTNTRLRQGDGAIIQGYKCTSLKCARGFSVPVKG